MIVLQTQSSSASSGDVVHDSDTRVAELEEEKGNLQLKLVEMEEEVSVKGQHLSSLRRHIQNVMCYEEFYCKFS